MTEVVVDISRLRRLRLPRRQIARVLSIVAVVAAVYLAFWSVLYQVGPDEIGVVQRFGRYVRTSQPGLRVHLPFVETVTNVPVQRQLRQEFGYRSPSGLKKVALKVSDESTMLTGDLNVAVVEWIVQYRIADAYKYVFRVRDVETVFRDMTQAVMQQVVGDRTLTEVVTVGRHDIETNVQQQLQQAVDRSDIGIHVEQVVLQDVNPPDPVKPSWDEVNRAQQDRDAYVNRARADYNKVVPRARGEAEQAVLAADGYALDRVNRAQGDASRFEQLDAEYRKAPDVTRRRLQLETMGRVLPKIGTKVILDKDARNVLPLLPLDTLKQAAAAAATAPTGGTK
jgi:membrane protease subunit HflK